MDAVTAVFDAVAETAPEIRDCLPGRRVASGEENPSGETQLAADTHADDLLADRIADVDGVVTYASEERDSVAEIGSEERRDAEGLHVAADPLDGSSNLKSNNAMGTIVSVYDEPVPARGRDLVGACYVLYGPITTMVVARDGVVREEVIHRDARVDDDASDAPSSATGLASGELATEERLSGVERDVVTDGLVLPENPTVYGFGGRVPDWTPEFDAFARDVESELKLRYGGAMVGDVNQVLTYGGVFAYPALESSPNGKLRLQFEANPIAYIVESAGGASSTGDGSILDADPDELHQRVPVHVGNEAMIERLEDALA